MANPLLTGTPSVEELRKAPTRDLLSFVRKYKPSAATEVAKLVIDLRVSRRLLIATWVLVVLTVVLTVATVTLIRVQ